MLLAVPSIILMAASTLGPRATPEQVRDGLAGNLCRCTGYEGIYRAVERASRSARLQAGRKIRSSARLQAGQKKR